MSTPYFHSRWYVDADGLLQRRTPDEQQRIEEQQINAGTWEPPDAARWTERETRSDDR